MTKKGAVRSVLSRGDEECKTLDMEAATVMSKRLMEAGDEVSEEEIMGAVLALRRAVLSRGVAGSSGYAQFGVVRQGSNSRKFRIWRDMGGEGVVDTETASGMLVSLESNLVEGTRLIQTKIPNRVDGGWDLHDTPRGGAARTTVRINVLRGQDASPRRGYVWKESHYSFGHRWDPSADTPAVNYYFQNGSLKCRQRFRQGVSRTAGDMPVFEGFYPDGTPRAIEYGNSLQGKHRPINLGPAYQEFHPDGSPSLIVFAEKGVQKGKALRFSPNGEKTELGKEAISCGTITIGEEWVMRDETSANPRGLGEALIEATRTHQGRQRKKSQTVRGRGR